jgi:E3 ubiquitin-protein ligase DOA10
MACRICLEDETDNMPFVHPCNCTGTMGNVHLECIQHWIEIRKDKHCELCKGLFDTTIVNIPCTDKEFYFSMYTVLLGCCISFIQVYTTWVIVIYTPGDVFMKIALFMIGSTGQIYLHAISIKTLVKYKKMIIAMPCIWYLTFMTLHAMTSLIAEKKIFNDNINVVLFASTGVFILSLCVGLRTYRYLPQID